MSTSVQPVAAPVVPAPNTRTLNQMVVDVSARTAIPATPVEPTPRVAIVRDAPAPVTSAPASPAVDGAVLDGASLSPSVSPAVPSVMPAVASTEPTEPTSELTLDDGTVMLRAERNADGTYKTKFDPTAKLDFEIIVDKKTGERKQYSKTLPEMVRLARDGVALQPIVQALKPEVEYYRKNVTRWQQELQQSTAKASELERQYKDMAALNRELLTADDEVVIQHREYYKQEQHPLKQAERERQSLESERQSIANEHRSIQAQSFIQSRLAPAISDAESVLGVDTVTGMIARATTPLLDRNTGQIPPEQWDAVERYVTGPLTQRVAAERAVQEKGKAEAAAREAATRAVQANAQRVVNDAGRATAPVGSAAPDRAAAPMKPKNVKDAIDQLVNRPLPQTI